MRVSASSVVLPCLITLLLLAGCSKSDAPFEAPPTEPAEAERQQHEAPVGRLGNTVVPTRYRLELRVTPAEESFSGNVSIDIEIRETLDSVWLHGKDFRVDEVFLTDAAGNRVAASYEQKHESGVSLVSLVQTVDVGPATLDISFRRPFDTGTDGLFRVLRGEDAYVATQFQPIAARKAFPGFDEPAFKVPFDLMLVTRSDHVAITTTSEIATEALEDGYVCLLYTSPSPRDS